MFSWGSAPQSTSPSGVILEGWLKPQGPLISGAQSRNGFLRVTFLGFAVSHPAWAAFWCVFLEGGGWTGVTRLRNVMNKRKIPAVEDF